MFLHLRLHRLLVPALLALFVGQAAWAGTVGKIDGVVTNKEKGQPLSGANVVIVGTTMGAMADAAGHYVILNVPAGTYQLQASVVGYKPLVVDNVRVAPDFTTDMDFALEQTVLGIVQTLEVRAEKPLVQKDLTGTARFIGRDEIANLPIRGYQDAAALQAGVVSQSTTPVGAEASNTPRLYVRGGRAEEVAYFVDGFSQQDPLTGLSTTAINQNAIDQIVVLTGGFNAEYGKIMSGAVNVITREGGSKYSGSVEAITDNLGGEWIGTHKYDNNTYDVSLGGPLVPGSDQATFFASAERRWDRDRSPRPIDQLSIPAQYTAYPGWNQQNNSLGGYTYQAKVAWALRNDLKLKLGTLDSRDNWQEFRQAYLFDVAHTPRYQDTNTSAEGTLTYTPTPKTLINFGGNYFYTERFRGDGVFFKDLNAYGQPAGNPQYSETMPIFYYGPADSAGGKPTGSHIWRDYLHRESSYVSGKADISSQWSPENQAKAGLEYRYHTLRRYRHLFPDQVFRGVDGGGYVDVDRFGYVLTDPLKHLDGGVDGAKHPKDASIYLQNKYEKDQFVLNAGIRYDYLNAETEVMANEADPLEPGVTPPTAVLKAGQAHNKVSPRLGVGFPVTDRTQFHANYGIFYQQPNLEDLYVGYNYLGYKVFTGGYYYPFGNPDLVPETTTAYEIGLKNEVGDNAVFDVTAFYKSVQNLIEVQSVRAAPNSYSFFENTDYGTIKGLDFTFDMRRTNNVTAQVNYTFSFANGTGSVANTQRNIAWTGGIPPKQTAPLDFDQRHKLAVNVDWRLPRNGGPELGGAHFLENFGVNVLLNVASGTPYTPTKVYDAVTLAAVNVEPTGPINSSVGPWTMRVDMKVDKTFEVQGLNVSAYVWVLNLFNRLNPTTVYTTSGVANETGWLANSASTYTSAHAQALYQAAQNNPANYDIPRMVRFGLKTSF